MSGTLSIFLIVLQGLFLLFPPFRLHNLKLLFQTFMKETFIYTSLDFKTLFASGFTS